MVSSSLVSQWLKWVSLSLGHAGKSIVMGNLSNGSGAGAESAATAGAPVMSAVCQTTVSQSTRQVRVGGETVMAALESPKR